MIVPPSPKRPRCSRGPIAPKSFWAVEGAGHVDLEAYAPDDYRQRVFPFLIARLQQPR